MMKRWLIGVLVLGLVPVGGVSVRGPLPLAVLAPIRPALAMSVPPVMLRQEERKAEGNRLTGMMEKELLKFVESNYPSRMSFVVRSLQSEESPLRRDLNEAVRFLQEFTLGNVTVEGNWQGSGGKRCYALLSVIHGVSGYPNATLILHTYPGWFRPFTVVEVDKEGDGRAVERSGALCRRDKMLDWLSKRFPQAACLARRK